MAKAAKMRSMVLDTKLWPYKQGFMNCPETPNPISLSVKGQIPNWIQGVLFRIGPGTFTIPSKKNKDNVFAFSHWFDGLAQVHRFEIKNGEVTYKSLNIAKGNENCIAELEGLPSDYFTFGQDICENMFKKFFTTFRSMIGMNNYNLSNPYNSNINVTINPWLPTNDSISATKSHQTLVAQTDANSLKEINATTLEPIQNFTFGKYDKKLHGQLSPAHPQYDSETGEYISFVGNIESHTEYDVFSIKRDPQSGKPITNILATIPGKPVYVHSFSLTKKYVILILWPAEFGASGLKILWNRNFRQAMKPWNPNEKTLFHVIDRSSRKLVATYTSPAFFCFHTLNAWDEEDDIVLDLVQYKDNSIIEGYLMETLLGTKENSIPDFPRFHRYRLAKISQQNVNIENVKNLPKAELVFDVPEELNSELSTIDFSRYHLKRHRYAYGISTSKKNPIQFADQLIKLDLDRNSDGSFSHKIWQQFGCTPSEPIFIPSPNSKAEDDGVITSVILDGNTGTSFLLLLDASTFTEIARAEMEPGKFVPYNFHGLWNNEFG